MPYLKSFFAVGLAMMSGGLLAPAQAASVSYDLTLSDFTIYGSAFYDYFGMDEDDSLLISFDFDQDQVTTGSGAGYNTGVYDGFSSGTLSFGSSYTAEMTATMDTSAFYARDPIGQGRDDALYLEMTFTKGEDVLSFEAEFDMPDTGWEIGDPLDYALLSEVSFVGARIIGLIDGYDGPAGKGQGHHLGHYGDDLIGALIADLEISG